MEKTGYLNSADHIYLTILPGCAVICFSPDFPKPSIKVYNLVLLLVFWVQHLFSLVEQGGLVRKQKLQDAKHWMVQSQTGRNLKHKVIEVSWDSHRHMGHCQGHDKQTMPSGSLQSYQGNCMCPNEIFLQEKKIPCAKVIGNSLVWWKLHTKQMTVLTEKYLISQRGYDLIS